MALVLLAGSSAAEPIDLSDARPRLVVVRFEISPADRPGQLDSVWSDPFIAWLEPAGEPELMRITVDGGVVESHLLKEHDAQPGTFSDFVWIFDAASGHVRSATVNGRLARRVRLGFASWTVDADIQVSMDTASPAGFERPQSLLGQKVRDYCEGGASETCTLVAPAPYDTATGYVRAVGSIAIDAPLANLRSFSPLGEARFQEVPEDRAELEGLAGWKESQVWAQTAGGR